MAVKFFSFLTVVFVSLLLIGLVLPGTWEVERSLDMPAAPEDVFAYVNDVSLWETWTHWPDADAERVLARDRRRSSDTWPASSELALTRPSVVSAI